MMLTEDEAKTKWCPFAKPGSVRPEDCGEVRGNRFMDGQPDPGALCIGSACMAWRASPSKLADDTPIAELELSVRAANALQQAGMRTVADIRRTPDIELLRIRNVGRITLAEIRDIADGPPPKYLDQTQRGYCGLAGRPE